MVLDFRYDEDFNYDINRGMVKTPEELGQTIAYHIAHKGYCIVDSGISLSTDDLQGALNEAKDARGRFMQPPQEIVAGLLGDEGTGSLCEIPRPGDLSEKEGMETLCQVDTFMTEIVQCMQPNFADLGIWELQSRAAPSRTKGLLVEGGSSSENAPALTEKACAKWMNIFLRHKLMMLLYLGPGNGSLQLRPYGESTEDFGLDEEQDWTEDIETHPGMLIILRADYLSHSHTSSDQDYMLCTYVLGPSLRKMGPRNEMKGAGPVTPVVKELTEWAMNRALEIKAQIVADGALATWDAKVPRSWERAMNHMYCTGLPVGIYGEGTKMPGPFGADSNWKVLATGADLVTDVNVSRWDHSKYYDPEPESYRKSSAPGFNTSAAACITSIRHACFMEGIELFDAKFFGISVAEAKGMDPNQRLVLETSYEALYMAGFKKKELSMAYIGVFGGSTNPDWGQIPMDVGAMSGTGSSEAIFCNRVSFCLGMQGPSTNIDCEMASSACAFYVACSQVCNSNPRHEMAKLDNPAALATGGFVMLTPQFWPRFNFWMNPIGRCFTFGEDAAGYVRGEGNCAFCLKTYVNRIDGEYVVADETPLGICSGYRMNNNGRNASMQAPNAAAEQDAVAIVLRQAGVTPLDVDAQECHGIGNLLQDAIEVAASSKVFRGASTSADSTFMMAAVKTQLGAQCEVSGHSQILKAVWSQRHGVYPASCHTKCINPHIELDDRPVVLQSEPLSYRCRASYHNTASRGFGGTNVNLLFWNKPTDEQVPVAGSRPAFRHQNWLLSWGGDDANNLQDDGYYEGAEDAIVARS
jgi:polyketide synthase-associated protein